MLLLRTATTTAAAKKAMAKFTATYLGPLCRRGSDEISCSITGHAFHGVSNLSPQWFIGGAKVRRIRIYGAVNNQLQKYSIHLRSRHARLPPWINPLPGTWQLQFYSHSEMRRGQEEERRKVGGRIGRRKESGLLLLSSTLSPSVSHGSKQLG